MSFDPEIETIVVKPLRGFTTQEERAKYATRHIRGWRRIFPRLRQWWDEVRRNAAYRSRGKVRQAEQDGFDEGYAEGMKRGRADVIALIMVCPDMPVDKASVKAVCDHFLATLDKFDQEQDDGSS